jgi:hypothetical protein
MAKEPDFLKGLGIQNITEEIQSSGVNRIIQDWGNQLIAALRAKLKKNKSNASGSLSANIQPTIEPTSKGEKLIITMNEYWVDVEEGQKPGTMVSAKSLIQWMKEKRRYGAFRSAFDKNIESVVARKISKNIYAGGTKARPFIKPTLTQKRINELSQNVADYFAANLFK